MIDQVLTTDCIFEKIKNQLLPPNSMLEKNMLKKNDLLSSVPEDIMVDILSRLPAKIVGSCRVVCSLWNCLTSSSHFVEAHLKKARPITIAHFKSNANLYKLHLLFVEDSMENTRFEKVSFGCHTLIASCNGFLLFENDMFPSMCVLHNPVTREEAVVHLSKYRVLGFFFDKEYKFLTYNHENVLISYWLYGLSSKTRRRLGTFSHSLMHVNTFASLPRALFWMIFDKFQDRCMNKRCGRFIMMFDLETEEFRDIPHPRRRC